MYNLTFLELQLDLLIFVNIMSKKSGAQYRQLKKSRVKENQQLASSWKKWLLKENNTDEKTTLATIHEDDENSKIEEELTIEDGNANLSSQSQETSTDDLTNWSVPDELNVKESIPAFDADPATWKRPYSQSMITVLVEKGPV